MIKTTMKIDKECKGSVRYKTLDENFPIQTVYVSRKFKPETGMPKEIVVGLGEDIK